MQTTGGAWRVSPRGEREGDGAPRLSVPPALPAGVPHRLSERSVVLGVATG